MNDGQQVDTTDPSVGGAGAQLRAAREAAGIHIAALAGALKVPVARLEALEADRFDLLPDPPFVRALAGSVCRALKIDAAPILARLPQRKPLPLEEGSRVADAPSFRAPPARAAGGAPAVSRPVLVAVGVLLVGALGLVLVPSERWSRWKQALQERMAPPAGSSSEAVSAGAVPSPAGTVMESVPSAQPIPPEPSAASAPVSPPPAAAPAAAPTVSVPVEAATPAGLVSFKATGDSWIKVTDARGTVVMQKLLTAGATDSISGEPPLAVVVGRADATEVQVRGRPFDLTSIARNNVARFEVK